MLKFTNINKRLFPAHAGVILMVDMGELEEEPFPRTRGGDPWDNPLLVATVNFSPHTRG